MINIGQVTLTNINYNSLGHLIILAN